MVQISFRLFTTMLIGYRMIWKAVNRNLQSGLETRSTIRSVLAS
jgi:hypothetical protein